MIIHPISVIIPTYNRKQFVATAIYSVLSQTCKCSQIIVVDDGSTDGTDELIRSIQSGCQQEIMYIQQDNKGPAAARNLGICNARYEYIAFLDSDDHWLSNKITKQFEYMRANPEFLISYTKEQWLRNGLHLNQKKRHAPKHGTIFSHCLDICMVGMSTVMIHRELFRRIGMFDTSFRCCEDYEFWLRASCRYPFLLVDDVLTVKEGGREDQVSFQYRIGMDKLRIAAIEKVLECGTLDENQKNLALKELKKKTTIYGKGCVRHGRSEEGQRYLDRAASIQESVAERLL